MQRIGNLNGENITYDHDISGLTIGMLPDGGVIGGGDIVGNKIQPVKAVIPLTRSNGQKILSYFESDEIIDIPASGTYSIYIEVDQAKIDDGTSNAENGTGIAEIKTGPSVPSQNSLLLASVVDGQITDERNLIPKIQSVAQRTDSLEEKMESAEGKIEQIENDGPKNFVVVREQGEDIAKGQAYFVGKGGEVPMNDRKNDDPSRQGPGNEDYGYSPTGNLLLTVKLGEDFDQLGDSIIGKNEGTSGWPAVRVCDKDKQTILSIDGRGNNEIRKDLWELSKNGPIYVGLGTGNVKGYYKYFSAGIYTNIGKKIRTTAIPVLGYKSVSFVIGKVGNPTELKKGFDFGNNETLSVIGTGKHEIAIPKGKKYLFIRREILDENNYYTINNVVLKNFDGGKKFLSTTGDPIREDFVGIEKKGGVKGEITGGIEMGLVETEKEDGDYYLAENGQITKTISGCYIGEVKNGILKIIGNSNKLAGAISNSATTGNISLGNAEGFITIYVNGEPKKIPVYGV